MKRMDEKRCSELQARLLVIATVFLVLHLTSFPAHAASIVINEILADPAASIAGDANADGIINSNQDEFIELVNSSGAVLDISGWTLADPLGVHHVFPSGTVLDPGAAVVVFGGGTPTGAFGGAIIQTASTPTLSLNNMGDTIIVNDGATDQVVVTYDREANYDQSITLSPEVSGTAYIRHSAAPGSNGVRFSPGTMIDGTPFGTAVPAPAGLLLFSSGLTAVWRVRRSASRWPERY